MKKHCNDKILLPASRALLLCCLLAPSLAAKAQFTTSANFPAQSAVGTLAGGPVAEMSFVGHGTAGGMFVSGGSGAGPRQVLVFRAGTNGPVDVGAALLKACDLNHDGKVTLAELKTVATACFKLWDTNNDGNLSEAELIAGFKQVLPELPEPQLPAGFTPLAEDVTPPGQFAKRVLAWADANRDGLVSLQELSMFLAKAFGQWDLDGSGALETQELAGAFIQLTLPEPAATTPVLNQEN